MDTQASLAMSMPFDIDHDIANIDLMMEATCSLAGSQLFGLGHHHFSTRWSSGLAIFF